MARAENDPLQTKRPRKADTRTLGADISVSNVNCLQEFVEKRSLPNGLERRGQMHLREPGIDAGGQFRVMECTSAPAESQQ